MLTSILFFLNAMIDAAKWLRENRRFGVGFQLNPLLVSGYAVAAIRHAENRG
jgi:hypothetical protein